MMNIILVVADEFSGFRTVIPVSGILMLEMAVRVYCGWAERRVAIFIKKKMPTFCQ